jgi:hypothetical protein
VEHDVLGVQAVFYAGGDKKLTTPNFTPLTTLADGGGGGQERTWEYADFRILKTCIRRGFVLPGSPPPTYRYTGQRQEAATGVLTALCTGGMMGYGWPMGCCGWRGGNMDLSADLSKG